MFRRKFIKNSLLSIPLLSSGNLYGNSSAPLKIGLAQWSLNKSINSGKPFMGICLGLQILFEKSEESPNVQGLSILKGEISKIKFAKNLKVPHMGWNKINKTKNSSILEGINSDAWMYFVHSFKFDNDLKITDSISSYGETFSASINKDNVFATQFHPEKSSSVGLNVLKNFADLCI